MATASKAEKKEEKISGKAFIAKFEKDKRIAGYYARYADDVKAPEAMVTLMTGLVTTFATTPAYAAAIDDAVAIKWFSDREQAIREKTRRDFNFKISTRDKTGVAASQFKGVLKFAVHPQGGVKAWSRIVEVAHNWSRSKDLANKVRSDFLDKKKACPDNIKLLSILKRLRTAGAGNETSLKVYVERAQTALTEIGRLYAKPHGYSKVVGELIGSLITLKADIDQAVKDKAEGVVRKARVRLATKNGKRIAA